MSSLATRTIVVVAVLVGITSVSPGNDRIPAAAAVLRPLATDPFGTLVEFDLAALADLAAAGPFDLSLPLAPGQAATVRLEQFRVVAPHARFVLGLDQRPLEFDPSSVITLRGEIAGTPDSHAYMAVSPFGIWGYAIDRSSGRRYGVTSHFADGTALPSGQALVFPVIGGGSPLPPDVAPCGLHSAAVEASVHENDFPDQRGDPGFVSGVRHIQIAIETDYEYFSLFGNTPAAAAYVVAAYGAVADIYVRDVNTTVTVVFTRLWDNPADLFDDPDPLGPFQDYWQANMGSVARDVAQFFTGRRNLPAGGVAYLNGLCNGNAYSWAGYVLGFFVDPNTPNAFNRDIIIPAHELGHNCGTGHTQDYGLDTCHIETSAPRRGSIMSYCGQTFTGGDANHDMWFHTVTADIMIDYITTRACIGFDCNRNGVEDSVDISSGTSPDSNSDGIPDDCQDCNGNSVLDTVDISTGTSLDRNANARPDECEPDCNGNSVPDDLDFIPSATYSNYDDFETDRGWTVSTQGATSGTWQRGVPVNDQDWEYDPASDGDGSGSCFLTQNAPGNTDVDNGSTTVTSPRLNLSAGNVGIGYTYFLRMTDPSTDRLLVEINSNDGVGTWITIATHNTDGGLAWRQHSVSAQQLTQAGVALTSLVRLRFTVNDSNPQSIVEAGLDGVFVGVVIPAHSVDLNFNRIPDDCEGDCDADGTLDYVEVVADMSLDLNRNVVLDSCEDCDEDGTLDLAELNHSHNVWVADLVSNALREYLGGYGTQTATSSATGGLGQPQDLIITADRRVLVTSRNDSRVVEYSVAGAFVRTLVASGSGGLSNPAALTIAPWGNLLVASFGSHSVLEYNINSGAFVRAFVPSGSGGLTNPFGLAFKPNGNLYVTSGASQVLEFDRTTGAFVRVFVAAAANGGLNSPRGVLWLPGGNLLVASHNTDQVLEYNGVTGAFVRQFSQVGDGTVLTLDEPWCLRLGPEGDVYCSRTQDASSPLPPPDPAPLHLSNARIYRFDVNSGFFVLSYIMGVNSNLVNPTGFDFVPDAGTDCNNNQFPDNCDIASGQSADVNGNGTPDECETICLGDINNDGVVDLGDLAILLSNFGTAGGAEDGDLTGDGLIDLSDLALMLARFGTVCP